MNFVSLELPESPPAHGRPQNYCATAKTAPTALSLRSGTAVLEPLSAPQYTPVGGFAQHRNVKSFKKHRFEAPARLDTDPYLLILLADQEHAEGREDQAITLIDAAFSAFDQTLGGDEAAFAR